MTSKLTLQSIQQECEAHRSDSEECTEVCLASSFGIFWGWGSTGARWADNPSMNGFLIKTAFTCPPIAQTDFYM